MDSLETPSQTSTDFTHQNPPVLPVQMSGSMLLEYPSLPENHISLNMN